MDHNPQAVGALTTTTALAPEFHGPQVTVVTMTRGRPSLLLEAINSVNQQCCAHVAEHLVLVDECEVTWRSLARDLPDSIKPWWVSRGDGELTGPRRLGRLRDIGARLARSPWLAFIDDDDLWLPTHLHSLLQTAASTGCEAVHCWRQVVYSDGRPYMDNRSPWISDENAARAEYTRLRDLGIVASGSNIIKDCAGPDAGEADVRLVDGGSWLMRTSLAANIGYSYDYDDKDFADLNAEDDKFLDAVLDQGISVASSKQATFVYRLGGFSNVFGSDGTPIHVGDKAQEPVSWA